MEVKSTIQKTLLGILALMLCGACVFLFAGCSPTEDASADNSVLKAEKVEGIITVIDEQEIRIDVASDSNGFLAGPVRVDITEIDKGTIESLRIGDMIVIAYPGIVGMSEPPFIAAVSIEIVK